MENRLPASVSFLHSAVSQLLQPAEYMLLMPLYGSVCLSGSENTPAETGCLLFLTSAARVPVRIRPGVELLQAKISAAFLESLAGVPQCPSAVVFPDDCETLAERMADLFDLQYNQPSASYLDLYTAACQLLQELARLIAAEHFETVRPDSGTDRQVRMTAWLEQNFRQPVQLQDFADAMGLSRQRASAAFHQETGIAFSDCLLQLRLQEAQRLLSTTDKSITSISEESGFPNTSSFHLAFQRRFQMTPKAWRQQNQNSRKDAPSEAQDLTAANRLLQERRLLYPRQETAVHMTEEVQADCSAPIRSVWTDILNVDSSAACLHPLAQTQLAEIQKNMHFKFVRLNNLITADLIEFFPAGREYRFTSFLRLIDFFRSIDLTPMLAFGSNWTVNRGFCTHSGGGYSTDPDSWQEMLRAMLQASIRHWGAKWVNTWRFEFSMPPILYGSNDGAAFVALYEASVSIIRELLPAARVGGPALAMDNSTLSRWKVWFHSIPAQSVDFISMEVWADCVYQTEQLSGQFGEPLEAVSINHLEAADTALAVQKVQQVRAMMQAGAFCEKNLYISALGIAPYQAMAAQVGGHCPAWLIKTAIELQPLADGLGCWKALNAEAEYADEYALTGSGCGLLERHGLHNPAWYAWRFLSALYDNLVFHGLSGIVTADGSGHYALLLHNCRNYSGYFCRIFREAQATEFQDPKLYTSYSALAETLILTALPPRRYQVSRYLTGDRHGCLAHVIRQTGTVDPRMHSIVEYIAGQSLPYQHVYETDKVSTLTLHISLQPNESMLILLDPLDES